LYHLLVVYSDVVSNDLPIRRAWII